MGLRSPSRNQVQRGAVWQLKKLGSDEIVAIVGQDYDFVVPTLALRRGFGIPPKFQQTVNYSRELRLA
jgi:hypothetical protein